MLKALLIIHENKKDVVMFKTDRGKKNVPKKKEEKKSFKKRPKKKQPGKV